jgi:hypothetical protein
MTVKELIGLLLIIIGVIFGLYVGIWVCFVGGIIDIIEQIRATNLEAMSVAWGVAKIVFAEFFGVISGGIIVFIGYVVRE